jgi:predicted transcriptional regulator
MQPKETPRNSATIQRKRKMSTNTDLREVVQFLAANPEPLWLLRHLRDEPSRREDIADTLALPVSDIQSPLTKLTEKGWAERTSEGYRITTLGAFITMEYLEFLNTLEEITASEQFIQELTPRAVSPIHQTNHQ